jgi:hypothetical protein
MKMREVIEAGREASPLINITMDSIGRCIERCQVLLDDMTEVKSNLSREAIASECVNELAFLGGEFKELKTFWSRLNEKLEEYKYKPRKQKKKRIVDLPGQQKLFEDPEPAPDDLSGAP